MCLWFTLYPEDWHLFMMTDSDSLGKSLAEVDGAREKKSKNKLKKEDAWRPAAPKDPFAMLDSLPEKQQQEIQRALHLFSMSPTPPKTLLEAKSYTYQFWDTQPVPKLGDNITAHGPIIKAAVSVRQEPYSLPAGFSWDTLDLSTPPVMKELCTLLSENYMQEDDNTMKLTFSPEYLQWLLQPPNWLSQWHCGVRVDANKKLVGFIAAVPADVRVYETQMQMVQVKLLCVHKKLRLKRMTPVLIREVVRQVNQQGLSQAVYAAAVVLPTPLSSCRFWHRPLNPQKLMNVNYPGLRRSMNLQRALKFFLLPEVTKTRGLRPMTREDVVGTLSLLQKNSSRFHLSTILSLQEVEHWLLPRENVVDTYVVEGEDGTLTDVVSFYAVSFKVLNHPVHSELRAAHLLHVASSATNLADLMEDTLVLAKSKGFDILSALDVMDNKSFLEKLKFNATDNSLHHYLYNWMCPDTRPDKVGLVLPS